MAVYRFLMSGQGSTFAKPYTKEGKQYYAFKTEPDGRIGFLRKGFKNLDDADAKRESTFVDYLDKNTKFYARNPSEGDFTGANFKTVQDFIDTKDAPYDDKGNLIRYQGGQHRLYPAVYYENLQKWAANQSKSGTRSGSIKGKSNMAATDTNQLSVTPPDDKLKGKTGEELQKAILQKQAGQAEATTLPDEKKVQVSKIDVKPDEVLDSEQYGMKEDRSVEMPGTIDAEKFRVEKPETVDAATYEASVAGDVGKVDAAKGKVSEEAQIKAAQGTLSPEALAEEVSADLDPRATTQYQLAELFKSIKDGEELPAWAAPAVRNVSAVMAQRGLGSSSMAAAAMTQAVMEQGINIATQDANKYATIQLQNLTAKQQTTLSNAAAIANMDLTNLNNRQIAAVNNAKAFLSIDVQNLNNEQQAATLNYQTTVSAMLTDAAQQNAAKQFNAKSQNEIEQFFQELGSQIENQTMNRVANLEQYNISQKTAVEQFNANQLSARDQFNANMRTQIDQSNAVWRRNVNTANTSLQNEANRINVQTLLGLTNAAQNNLWQLYRDQAQWAMSTSENNLDRAHNAAMQAAAISANASVYDEKFDNFLLVKTIDNIFN